MLVQSVTDASKYELPELHQEDGLTIDFRAVRYVGGISNQLMGGAVFEVINLAGISLQIAVGIANTIYASTITWTPNEDSTILTGALNLNTAAIDALADGALVTFEIKLAGTYPYRGQFPVRIRKSVVLAETLGEPELDIALGRAEADAKYLPQNDCPPFTMYHGGVRFLVTPHEDGSMRCQRIT